MSEDRPPYGAPASNWRERLAREAEALIKNKHRPAVIVLRYNGDGTWSVYPPCAPPVAKVAVDN